MSVGIGYRPRPLREHLEHRVGKRIDDLDPLTYMDDMPSLMSVWGRVDIHTIVGKFLEDNKILGAYLEFGVGKGRSAVSAVRAYRRARVCDRFVLFDSFRGLPELKGADEGSQQFREGDYAFSRDDVVDFLRRHDVDPDSMELCSGWIEESFPAWTARNAGVAAAVVHIDVDLHSACKAILDHLMPFLQQGAVILFDDWNCFKASSRHGERRATREWLSANPHIQLHSYCGYGWSGHAFLVDVQSTTA
jgi:O-methyltransferase